MPKGPDTCESENDSTVEHRVSAYQQNFVGPPYTALYTRRQLAKPKAEPQYPNELHCIFN